MHNFLQQHQENGKSAVRKVQISCRETRGPSCPVKRSEESAVNGGEQKVVILQPQEVLNHTDIVCTVNTRLLGAVVWKISCAHMAEIIKTLFTCSAISSNLDSISTLSSADLHHNTWRTGLRQVPLLGLMTSMAVCYEKDTFIHTQRLLS